MTIDNSISPTTNYLNDNGIDFLINRYSGTLIRTE